MSSLLSAFTNLVNSVLGIFSAFLNLFQAAVGILASLVHTVIAAITGVLESVAGIVGQSVQFVISNIVILTVLGIAYMFYQNSQKRGGARKRIS